MKTQPWLGLAVALLLVGCETADMGIGERFRSAPAVQHVLAADAQAVFDATRDYLPAMGFKVTRSRPREGVIEGVSGVQVAGDMRGARQTTVKIVLAPTLEGETELQIWMSEVIQDDYDKSPGVGTQTPLRDPALYRALVHGIARQLGLPENE